MGNNILEGHNRCMHFINLGDERLAYADVGRGSKTCLFVHGMGSNMKAWRKNIDGIKGTYRCISIDLPGYGQSTINNDFYSIPELVDIILKFIQVLQLSNVILIGHSMGGHICIEMASRNDERIKQLVLMAPAGLELFTQEEKDWILNTLTVDVIEGYSTDTIVSNFETNFFNMPDDARFMIADRLLLKENPNSYRRFCNTFVGSIQSMLDYPVFDKLKSIGVRVLMVFGQEDKLIPQPILHPEQNLSELAQAGCNQLQKSQLVFYSEAGHFVHWEKADEVNELILKFIEIN
jgi:pimeloyl-ACP methyl ester carboxylesterase